MKYLKYLFALALLASTHVLQAQEFRCEVTIQSQNAKVQTDYKQIFDNMKSVVENFMNNRRWTEEVFRPEERIEVSLLLNLNTTNGTDFTGTMQVQSSRPVYNTSYSSGVLKLADQNIRFTFIQFQPLDFVENSYTSELVALLAFYGYIILGMDFDTYSPLGGTPYFTKANAILNASQASSAPGWSSREKDQRNRFFLANDLLDNRFKPYREVMYTYHMKGMDTMFFDVEAGLKNILKDLEKLREMNKLYTNSYLLSVFFDTKSWELISLYRQAPASLKTTCRDHLVALDPFNASRYYDKLK